MRETTWKDAVIISSDLGIDLSRTGNNMFVGICDNVLEGTKKRC